MRLILLLIIVLLIVFSFSGDSYVEVNSERIEVEIADSPEERGKGLMFREELCDDCGMLFVFDEPRKQSFWMKDTLIELDIIFINSDLEVIHVAHAFPCKGEVCTTYSPNEEALYVLEVNHGRFSESLIGKKIKLNL